MSRAFPLLFATLPVAVMAVAACGGGNNQDANTGQPQPVQCPPGQMYNGQYCVMANAPPPTTGTNAGTTTPPPPSSGTPTGPGPTATGGSATPLDPTAAQAATALLGGLAQKSAPPGAKPIGSVIAGNFQQGQSLETQVQFQPGRCYTVVGAAVPTVQNLDIKLVPVVPIPGMSPVIASDQSVGPTAVLGEQPNCYKWAAPLAAPMKVVITVSSGQGLAAAQNLREVATPPVVDLRGLAGPARTTRGSSTILTGA